MQNTLPWSVYANQQEGLSRDYHTLFNAAESFLSFASQYYGLEIPTPKIVVSISREIDAFATPEREIHITTGFLEWSKSAAGKNASIFEKIFPGLRSMEAFVHSHTILWVCAHEFSHIARGHFQFLERHPGKNLLIEIDADTLAVGVLYRHLWELGEKNLRKQDPQSLKITILMVLFWPIREMIGSSGAINGQTHPSWHARLENVLHRLAALDNQGPKGVDQISFNRHMTALAQSTRSLCTRYAEAYSITVAEDPASSYFENGLGRDVLRPLLGELESFNLELRRNGFLSNLRPEKRPQAAPDKD